MEDEEEERKEKEKRGMAMVVVVVVLRVQLMKPFHLSPFQSPYTTEHHCIGYRQYYTIYALVAFAHRIHITLKFNEYQGVHKVTSTMV